MGRSRRLHFRLPAGARVIHSSGKETLAGEQGFEPWYAGIKIQCLNQLGDSPTLKLYFLSLPQLYFVAASTDKILFYNSLICKSDLIGCFVSDFAFHAFHLLGT